MRLALELNEHEQIPEEQAARNNNGILYSLPSLALAVRKLYLINLEHLSCIL